ncbi:hypothetical protein LCGC14_3091280, partial [marine sediment metagenome]
VVDRDDDRMDRHHQTRKKKGVPGLFAAEVEARQSKGNHACRADAECQDQVDDLLDELGF